MILGLWVDTEDVTVRLPQRKVEGLRQRLASWPPEQREATAREVLSLAGKLHHVAYVQPLPNAHLTEKESRGRGDAWGRFRKRAEV